MATVQQRLLAVGRGPWVFGLVNRAKEANTLPNRLAVNQTIVMCPEQLEVCMGIMTSQRFDLVQLAAVL